VPATDRDDLWRHARDPDLGERRDFGDHGIAALSTSRAHHPPTIVHGNVGGQCFSHGIPVAGREVRLEALGYLAGRVLQSPRWRAFILESCMHGIEFGDRGIEVFGVEHNEQRDTTVVVEAVKM